MERWNLTYEDIVAINPEAIYARMSGFGHSGPDQNFRSYGPVVQAVSGLTFSAGLPGTEPSGWGMSYMDNQAAYNASAAILMAIHRRNATGHGTEIGPARFEGIPFIAERARPAHWRSAPLLGEDNRYVFTEVVGPGLGEHNGEIFDSAAESLMKTTRPGTLASHCA